MPEPILRMFVPTVPKGKERPRHSAGRIFTPKATHDWEEAAALLARAELKGKAVCTDPVALMVLAVFRRPKNRPKIVSASVWARNGRVLRPGRPDGDNILKIVADALQHRDYGILKNDSQIVAWTALSCYGSSTEKEGVWVVVERLDEYDLVWDFAGHTAVRLDLVGAK